MSTILWWVLGFILVPLGAILFWVIVAAWLAIFVMALEWFEDRTISDRLPSCDIDPRCHPAFVWRKDGKGQIGNTTINMEGR